MIYQAHPLRQITHRSRPTLEAIPAAHVYLDEARKWFNWQEMQTERLPSERSLNDKIDCNGISFQVLQQDWQQ
jgi:hypothetical protein